MKRAQDGDGSKPVAIQERCFDYAVRAIKIYQYLHGRRDGTGWIIGKQYLRSAMSIGANVEEAQAGESRADFIHKMCIAQKEARESLYWLRLMRASSLVTARRIDLVMHETEEILAIISKIIINAKKQSR